MMTDRPAGQRRPGGGCSTCPSPVPGPTEVLVRTVSSVISAGTERAVTGLAQSSLLAKARARPDLVRQVVSKARSEGLAATTAQAVRGAARRACFLPLGYSAAGRGRRESARRSPGIGAGQLVATGGTGQGQSRGVPGRRCPGLLCSTGRPATVSAQDAAFTTIASIALHGLRIAEAGPGSKVVVVGLGLIGQLAARLALAAGCDVAGIDPAGYPREAAARAGVLALDECGAETTEQVLAWSRGRGADAVLVLRRRAFRRRGDAGTRAVQGPGGGGHRGGRRAPAQPDSVLRARAVPPVRALLRSRPLRPVVRGLGRRLPGGRARCGWTEGRNFEAVLGTVAAEAVSTSGTW